MRSCVTSSKAGVLDSQGISHTAGAIHQEVIIKASRKRVYEVLTDTEQFRKLSGGMDTKISRDPGGAFSLFGGVITGRYIELVPGERIVQAWRSDWAPGDYSNARFVLQEQGLDTKIVFDHTRLPAGRRRAPRDRMERALLGWARAIFCLVDSEAILKAD